MWGSGLMVRLLSVCYRYKWNGKQNGHYCQAFPTHGVNVAHCKAWVYTSLKAVARKITPQKTADQEEPGQHRSAIPGLRTGLGDSVCLRWTIMEFARPQQLTERGFDRARDLVLREEGNPNLGIVI